jgi:hypothetical protein
LRRFLTARHQIDNPKSLTGKYFESEHPLEASSYTQMNWSPKGVLALEAMEAARCNGEKDRWRQDRELPEREPPGPMRKAA